MRLSVTHFFDFLMTLRPMIVRRFLAFLPFLAGFGALSILALNFSLHLTSQEAKTFSLRGLITRWAGTRSVMSLGARKAGVEAGATPGPAGVGGFGVGGTGSLALICQVMAISTLEPCWALSPSAGPGGTPVSGNSAVTL